jgi:hypothetical protein
VAHRVYAPRESQMDKKSTTAAVERLEGVAGEFLEDKIADLEKAQKVKVKEVEVAVIPDLHGHSPAVTVVVTTKP